MSDGPKLPRAIALELAETLVRELAFHLDPGGVLVCGSLRRERQNIGDIDLAAELPMPGGDDRLAREIIKRFTRRPVAGMLFEPKLVKGSMGWIRDGAVAGFKACRLTLVSEPHTIDVEIHRYVAGPVGNRGWVELMRTGPVEFSQWLLTRHKVRQGRSTKPGSVHGYLVDREGAAIPTPTEADVFRLVGLEYIPPAGRDRFCEIHNIRRAS